MAKFKKSNLGLAILQYNGGGKIRSADLADIYYIRLQLDDNFKEYGFTRSESKPNYWKGVLEYANGNKKRIFSKLQPTSVIVNYIEKKRLS